MTMANATKEANIRRICTSWLPDREKIPKIAPLFRTWTKSKKPGMTLKLLLRPMLREMMNFVNWSTIKKNRMNKK